MPPPLRHPRELLTEISALVNDPRAQAGMKFLDAILPRTAAQVRELSGRLPEMAEAIADDARSRVISEAASLDSRVSRIVSGALDDLLTRAQGRVPKDKRLTAGSQSRARQAARRSRSE